MKKYLCFLLCLCLLLCLAACREDLPQPPESTGDTLPTEESTPPESPVPVDVRIVSVQKNMETYFQWAEDSDVTFVRSEHCSVTLDREDAPAQAILVSGTYDAERNHYLSYCIYTQSGDELYQEDCYAYAYHPYFVKTEGGHFLYLFREDMEEGMRQMCLTVLSLHGDGTITKVGETNLSPAWLSDNAFVMPLNPQSLILDDWGSGVEQGEFTVGDHGLPQQIPQP